MLYPGLSFTIIRAFSTKCAYLGAWIIPGFSYSVKRLNPVFQPISNLCRQISHARIHPISRTWFLCKPPMHLHRQKHFVAFVVQSLWLVIYPQEPTLTIALVYVNAQIYECCIYFVVKGICVIRIRGAFYGDSQRVILLLLWFSIAWQIWSTDTATVNSDVRDVMLTQLGEIRKSSKNIYVIS